MILVALGLALAIVTTVVERRHKAAASTGTETTHTTDTTDGAETVPVDSDRKAVAA